MRRLIKIVLLLAVPLTPLVLLGLALEGAPLAPANPTVAAGDAARTRTALMKLKYVLDPYYGWSRYSVSEAELNSLLAVAARGLPSLRGRAWVTPKAVGVVLSGRLTTGTAEAWLNLRIVLRPGPGTLQFEAFRVGRLELPGKLVTPLLRLALNAALGEGLGDVAVAGVRDLSVRGRSALITVKLTAAERFALLARSKKVAGQFAPVGDPARVREHYRALALAAEAGRLPERGSLVPYLRFALALADRRAAGGAVSGAVPDELSEETTDNALAEARAAILALAVYCGHWRVQYLVGEMIKGDLKPLGSRCSQVTLASRGDLRQHFIISAALEVASNSGTAFSVGEYKELLDSNPRGSGFSFDDLAADRAGIRFAVRLLEAAPEPAARAALIASLTAEGAVFPDIEGLPEDMSDADFKRDFDDVDSPRYRALLALIDRRIDRLAFYAE